MEVDSLKDVTGRVGKQMYNIERKITKKTQKMIIKKPCGLIHKLKFTARWRKGVFASMSIEQDYSKLFDLQNRCPSLLIRVDNNILYRAVM